MSDLNAEAKPIFLEALDREAPHELDRFLDRACGRDAALRARVEELLRAHQDAGNFLGRPDQTAVTQDRRVDEGPGTVIGSYKLLEQIGEGGFGVVFMAEQQQPLRRKVALKILKPGMDTRHVVARFEAERQALALMDHPNIAKVLEGGATASGRPYFVMDLVKGVPITDYCDQNQLTTRERLGLFVSVCQAVQHAHQKGIIHRDIKPSNVLVTLHDGNALVKVIDFGIAKALGQQLTDKTLFTGFAQLIGTPLYMAPEQAALSNADVDTRSDIYSLGVLLYQLLTGATPFDKDRFKEVGYDEICRILREEEPPRPSTRLSTLGQAAATVSTQRKSDPKQLSQLFRGELDWIVMKCLEKDRNRRYETASSLAKDIERYLHNEPVQACPPSARYRLGKFVRRHKGAISLVVFVFVAVAGAGLSMGWALRDRAVREEEIERDQQARQQALEKRVYTALDDAAGFQAVAKWAEAVAAVKRAEGILADGGSAELRQCLRELQKDLNMVLRLEEIRLPRTVGGVEGSYDNGWADASYVQAFQDYGIAVTSLSPAEAAQRIQSRPIRLELIAALDNWVWVRKTSGKKGGTSWQLLFAVARLADPDDWRNQVRDALEHGKREALNELAALAPTSKLPVQTLSLLAVGLDLEHCETFLRKAQRDHPDDFWINFQLAWTLHCGPNRGKLDDAVRFYTAALAARPKNAPCWKYLGDVLCLHRKLEDADAAYRKAIDLEPGNRPAHAGLVRCAFMIHHKGQTRQLRERAIVALCAALKVDPPDGSYRAGLCQLLLDDVKGSVPIPEIETALPTNLDRSLLHYSLGCALRRKGQGDAAIGEFREAIRLREDCVDAHYHLGAALLDQRQVAAAIDQWQAAIDLKKDSAAYNRLAWLLATCPETEHRNPGRAIELARRAVELAPKSGNCWNTLGVAHYSAGDWKAAHAALKKAVELRSGGDSFDWFFLAMTQWQSGQKLEARTWYDKAVQWMDKNQPKNEELRRFRAEAEEVLGIKHADTSTKQKSSQ
jgi:serine/threonine protein kinase/Flp pilus assembly protein TadD